MIISEENKNRVNDLFIHDSLFSGYSYDYDNRSIVMIIEKPWENKLFTFCFRNVIYSEMQSCNFWGKGANVMYASVFDCAEEFQRLFDIQTSNAELYDHSLLNQGIKYITFEVNLNSGDSLLVICETIDVTEGEHKGTVPLCSEKVR